MLDYVLIEQVVPTRNFRRWISDRNDCRELVAATVWLEDC